MEERAQSTHYGMHVNIPSTDTGYFEQHKIGSQTPSERNAKFMADGFKSNTMRSDASDHDANTYPLGDSGTNSRETNTNQNHTSTETDDNRKSKGSHAANKNNNNNNNNKNNNNVLGSSFAATTQYLATMDEADNNRSIEIDDEESQDVDKNESVKKNKGIDGDIAIVNYTPSINGMGNEVEISMIEAYIDTDDQIIQGSVIIHKNVELDPYAPSDEIEESEDMDDDTEEDTKNVDFSKLKQASSAQSQMSKKHYAGQSTMESAYLNAKHANYKASFATVDMWQADFRADHGNRDQEELFNDFLGSSEMDHVDDANIGKNNLDLSGNNVSSYNPSYLNENETSQMTYTNDRDRDRNSFVSRLPPLMTKATLSAGTINESKSVSYDWEKNELKSKQSSKTQTNSKNYGDLYDDNNDKTSNNNNNNENTNDNTNDNKMLVKVYDPQSQEITSIAMNGKRSSQKHNNNNNNSNLGQKSMVLPQETTTLTKQNTLTLPTNNNNKMGGGNHKGQKRSLILKIKAKDMFQQPNFQENLKYFETLSKLNDESNSKSNKDETHLVGANNYSNESNASKSGINIGDWTHRDVCNWLKDELLADNTLNIKQITKILVKFEMNYISGHVLLVLDQELLESIGIDKNYIQEKILKLTRKLAKPPKTQLQHIPSGNVPTGTAQTSLISSQNDGDTDTEMTQSQNGNGQKINHQGKKETAF